jgi:hypothetical protein
VGPRVGLDIVEKRKILPLSGTDPGRPSRNLSLFPVIYPCYSV